MSQMTGISRMSKNKSKVNKVIEFTEFSMPKIRVFLYTFKSIMPNIFTIF